MAQKLFLLLTIVCFCDTTITADPLQHDAARYVALGSPTNNNNNDHSSIRYDAPDDCQYLVAPNQDITLVCNLRTVNSEYDTTNFSVIPSDHTVALSIICDDELMVKSKLMPKSFSHLVLLKDLSLEYCKIDKFHEMVLSGLYDLRNLTIRTHNINWPAFNLEIDARAFVNTTNLERLDLSMNNIWSLPENLFCALNGLRFLNISGNRLQDINDFGFREKGHQQQQQPTAATTTSQQQNKTTRTNCVLDLEILDVSFNHFVLLPANAFGTLKRLRYLKVDNNELSMVADKALEGLKNLKMVDMSSNKIVALPSELFRDQQHRIEEIYLQNNSISVLSPDLFSNLTQLQALDLSTNQLTSAWINKNTFKGLIRLVLLDLSYNKINKLDPEIFTDLFSLQVLNLRSNQLDNLAADTFALLNNLHKLYLSHNRIKYLDAYSLNQLYALSELAIDNNILTGVHPEAFRNCSALEKLHLNGNELTKVPLALKDMRFLQEVDLGENLITVLEEPGFRGMHNLKGLRLISNRIENITRKAFTDLPSLQILNLARNKIQYIEEGTFDMKPYLQAIRLDDNALTSIDGLFENVPNLTWLNVSDNQISTFDYSQIPGELQWLDLHKNELGELTNVHGLDNQLNLRTLDASFNKITRLTPNSFPNSIELLFLNDNLITEIEPHSFMHKQNLIRVDLYANRITSLDQKALRLTQITDARLLPEFYIGGNPFICDCNIEWLKNINSVTTRTYPRIMDIDKIYCKLLYNRNRSYIQLIDAQPEHFLCEYKTHCFTLCQCCDFDACDCKMTCPNNCTCFHDQSWSTNIVECSAAGYMQIPSKIPMDTTEVYIDGNNLIELTGHSFIGRKNLRVLFANNSNIHTIHNMTFYGLKRLAILHLENNHIERIHGTELGHLENLRELYLQNNKISHVQDHAFTELKKLEVLQLDGNRLINFEVWQLTANPYLVDISLADNLWTCDCGFLNKFKIYLSSNTEKIADHNRIGCVYNNLTNMLKDKNGTIGKCAFREGMSSIVHSREIEDLLPLLLAATCAFVGFFGLVVGIFCYRKELKLWLHDSCLMNLCYKSGHFVNEYDKDRNFDAYVVYSIQDEAFVNQNLAHTLEASYGYRLFLQYRDINVNRYIADSIIEAVDSSKRAVLVLSKNFLYNEWTRFEFKGAVHEILKRRRKLIIVLYGDLPQRDLDADIRLYLRTNTCIEWDDKKFWQKLKIAMPSTRKSNNCLTTRSGVNIYATAHDYNATTARRGIVVPANGVPVRLDCNNYATINNYSTRDCDNYETTHAKYNTTGNNRGGAGGGGGIVGAGGATEFSIIKSERHQHEYAVPTNCLLDAARESIYGGSGSSGNNNSGGRPDDFEWASSTSHASSDCSHSLASSHGYPPSAGGNIVGGVGGGGNLINNCVNNKNFNTTTSNQHHHPHNNYNHNHTTSSHNQMKKKSNNNSSTNNFINSNTNTNSHHHLQSDKTLPIADPNYNDRIPSLWA